MRDFKNVNCYVTHITLNNKNLDKVDVPLVVLESLGEFVVLHYGNTMLYSFNHLDDQESIGDEEHIDSECLYDHLYSDELTEEYVDNEYVYEASDIQLDYNNFDDYSFITFDDSLIGHYQHEGLILENNRDKNHTFYAFIDEDTYQLWNLLQDLDFPWLQLPLISPQLEQLYIKYNMSKVMDEVNFILKNDSLK